MAEVFYQPCTLTATFTKKGMISQRYYLEDGNNIPILASTKSIDGHMLYLFKKEITTTGVYASLDLDRDNIIIYCDKTYEELLKEERNLMWAPEHEMIIHGSNSFHKNKLNL